MIIMIIGIVVFLGLTIISRLQMERSMKLLNDEERGKLLIAFSSARKWTAILLSVIVIAFMALAYGKLMDVKTATFVFYSALGLYLVWIGIFNQQKVNRSGFPEAFVRLYKVANILRVLSWLVLLLSVAYYIITEMEKNVS